MDDILTHFSKSVDDYDSVADAVVMRNDELHLCLMDSIPFDTSGGLRILDLGCGTGYGMRLALERFHNARVVGIDFSRRMIEKSGANLSAFKGRFELREADFNFADFGMEYDAVISAAAIHNSTHEQKRALFGKVFRSLACGGVFINGDFVAGETPEADEQYRDVYRNYLEKHLSGSELKAWMHHAFGQDKPMPLSEQFAALKEAGFRDAKAVWQFGNEAVYVARK